MERDQKDLDLAGELNDLMQLDFDAAKTYEVAIAHVDQVDVKADLELFRRDHLRHIDDLTSCLRALGGEAKQPGRDAKGFVLESLTRLRSVAGTIGALKAMRTNEKLTNKSYDTAVALPLPVLALELVRRHVDDERRHLAAIDAHIERLSARGDRDDRDDGIDAGRPDLRPGGPL